LAETEGVFAEQAEAASVAVLKKLLQERPVDEDEKIVCMITSADLKDVKSTMKVCGKSPKLKSWDDCRPIIKIKKDLKT